MRTNDFDPLAYIESAFLDTHPGPLREEDEPDQSLRQNGRPILESDLDLDLPTISDYLGQPSASTSVPRNNGQDLPKARFRKTVMSAPRPRKAKSQAVKTDIDPELHTVWTALPKNVAFLCSFFDDEVTKNYYRGEFKESREALIRRLLDPELSLEETARLLGVCPATVRRYTNRSWLAHHRTTGGQRRFRLSDIVRFVGEHGRLPEK